MKQVVKNTIEKMVIRLKNNKRENVYTKKINSIIEQNKSIKPIDDANIKKYWDDYGIKVDTSWHKAYISVNGEFDARYITEPIFYNDIEPSLNDERFILAYSDKNSYSKFLNGLQLPETIVKNIRGKFYDIKDSLIVRDEVEKKLKEEDGKFIIKPSLETGGGKGVELIEVISSQIYLNDKKVSFDDLITQYKSDFLIQKAIKQYDGLSKIYPNSINTIRIATLRIGQDIVILSSLARFGNNGSIVDNQAAGGIACGVDDEGRLKKFGVDKLGNKYSNHPYTDFPLEGVKIPDYEVVCQKIKNMHKWLPYFDLISWDIAIDEKQNPVVIELNLRGQEINFHQFNNGALFGDYTEDIIRRLQS